MRASKVRYSLAILRLGLPLLASYAFATDAGENSTTPIAQPFRL